MATRKQIAANRKNAQKSTGPRTPEGRAASSGNARRHGLTAHYSVIQAEDQDGFQRLLDAFCHDLQPSGAIEEDLVQQVAVAAWRLRRLRNMESGFFDMALIDSADSVDSCYDYATTDLRLARVVEIDAEKGVLLTLSRYEVRLERSYFRALHEIQRIQAARAAQELPPIAAGPRHAASQAPLPPANSAPALDIKGLPNKPDSAPRPASQPPSEPVPPPSAPPAGAAHSPISSP
jgi:hypothetical protein